MPPNDFPGTRFAVDVLLVQLGKLTLEELRKRYANGDYKPLSKDMAAGMVRLGLGG